MKIAFVYDAIYPFVKGGAEKRIWEISKRLAYRGHEVHIFGLKWWEGDATLVKEGVHLHGVGKAQLYTKDGRRSIYEALYFSYKVLPPLLKQNFDVIDCSEFPYFSCYSAKIASWKNKIPLIITWHEVWGDYWYNYLGWRGFFGKIIEKSVIKLPDKIFAVSSQTKKDLTKAGAEPSKVEVVP
ncbi:MAG: glycosyltransferase, partial [Deferribacteres bacterium]|nr:glycosyltransferase [Deferribacteres bacterium]